MSSPYGKFVVLPRKALVEGHGFSDMTRSYAGKGVVCYTW
jgi:hypothetical protein